MVRMELPSLGVVIIYYKETKMNCQNKKFNQGSKDAEKSKKENKNTEKKQKISYKLLYVRTGELRDVTADRFGAMKGAVIDFTSFKVRVIGDMPRSQVRRCVLDAQGSTGLFSGFTNMISSLIDTHSKVVSIINGAENVFSKLNKRFTLIVVKLLMEFISFSRSDSNCKLESLLSICLSIYSLVDHFELQAQGLETVLLATAMPFLPHQLKEVLKHITLLSSTKVLDDFSLLQRLFDLLEKFLLYVTQVLGIGPEVSQSIVRLFSYVGFGSKHRILSEMKRLMEEASKDKRIFNGVAYRIKCMTLNKEFESCSELQDWCKRCGSVADLLTRWRFHIKIVQANEETSRVEPNLFVFEGPPSCGKSVLLNQVLSVLGCSTYCHSVPDINEGKDFYDSYNFEDVFYMDDVGQKGISQWRTIINMVSSVKMPLECAEAKLKDTKFFNSHTILASTNQFMTLDGLCRTDGIANLEALWRRAFVFDFGGLIFDKGLFKGRVVFRHYSLKTKRFEQGFPDYFKLDQLDKSKLITEAFSIADSTSDMEGVRIWMGSIIKAFEIKKRNIQRSHTISEATRDANLTVIRDTVRDIMFPKQESVVSYPASDISLGNFKFVVKEHEEAFVSADEGLSSQGFLDFVSDMNIKSKVFSFFGSYVGSIIADLLKDELCKIMENWADIKLWQQLGDIKKKFNFYVGGVICVISALVIYAVYAMFGSEKSVELVGQGEKFTRNTAGEHNAVESLMKNTFECTIRSEDIEMSCQCLVSGRSILLPAHLSPAEFMKIKIYRSKALNHVWLEFTEIKREYLNNEYDVALYTLPKSFPSPFKSMSQWFGKNNDGKEQFYLISGLGYRKIDVPRTLGSVSKYSFRFGERVKEYLTKKDYVTYDVQASGLCGSILFSTMRGVLGMHVAGHVMEDFGVATVLSVSVLTQLREILEEKKPVVKLDFEFSGKNRENSSVIQFFGTGLQSHTPSSSNIVDSALYGIYPVDRYPADLNKYGKDTLKEVSKKSFTPCVALKEAEVRFCRLVLNSMIGDFGVLSDGEVVGGTTLLAGLNKDSSNGFGLSKNKEDYINFVDKKSTDLFTHMIHDIEVKASSGEVDWRHVVWQECLKDELRNEEKDGVPRSFRIGTLTQQYLVKKYFGRMVEHIMSHRSFNKIMVGCNPVKEWPLIYERLVSGKVFAGDIKNWDGSMNAELQQLVAEVLVDKSLSTNKNLLWALVGTLTNSLVVVGKDTFLTTHSMPSGSYLTAIMNSIVNKLYTAIWYFRNVKHPTLLDFWDSVDDFVYGDDKLNVVRKHHDTLNAVTMKEFFESVNMGFTDSMKNPISSPFQDISEVTFLKRSFVYHNLLKKIVCPLELRVIQNTLSYYTAGKDHFAVLQDKLHAAQREFFLHPNRDALLSDLYHRLETVGISYTKLGVEYLLSVYLDENAVLPLGFGVPDLYF